MTPEQKHYNEVRNSIGLMKNEDERNNYGNHATAIAVLEKHLESLSGGTITVPKQTWEQLVAAVSFMRKQVKEWEQGDAALTAANAASHPDPETTPAPEGGAITAESAANAVSAEPQAQGEARSLKLAKQQWESWKKYALELQDRLVKYEGGAPMVLNATHPQATEPAGWKLVSVIPTEEQWGGLARDIMMWMDMDGRKTAGSLFKHLERCGTSIPQWLRDEPEMKNLDHVPSKGTRVTIIYRAMLAAAPEAKQ